MKEHKEQWYRRIGIVVAILACTYFFALIYPIFLATHDDIQYYMWTRSHTLSEWGRDVARYSGRFYQNYAPFLYGIPYALNHYNWMKFIQYGALLFSSLSLWHLVRKHIDAGLAYMVLLLFWGFAQIDMQHNCFICYILYHQAGIGSILLAISFLLDYLKEKKAGKLVLSAVCYAVPLFLYEAYIFYLIVFGLICIFANKGRIWDAIKTSRWHILVTVVYLFVYCLYRKFWPGTFTGSTFYFPGSRESIRTILTIGTGLFPLRVWDKNFSGMNLRDILPEIRLHSVLLSAVLAAAIASAFARVKEIKAKRFFSLLTICLAAAVLPCMPYGFTPKYVEETKTGIYGYVPSYFSYFFWILVIALIAVYAYQKIRMKRVVLALLSACLFFAFLLTGVSNQRFAEAFKQQGYKYKAFDTVVSSEPFLELEDGAVVYIPDYIGIHGVLDYSEDYLKIYSDTEIELENDPGKLNFDDEVYEMRYLGEGVSVFAKIDSDFMTDKMWVYLGTEPAEKAGLYCGEKEIHLQDGQRMTCVEDALCINDLCLQG